MQLPQVSVHGQERGTDPFSRVIDNPGGRVTHGICWFFVVKMRQSPARERLGSAHEITVGTISMFQCRATSLEARFTALIDARILTYRNFKLMQGCLEPIPESGSSPSRVSRWLRFGWTSFCCGHSPFVSVPLVVFRTNFLHGPSILVMVPGCAGGPLSFSFYQILIGIGKVLVAIPLGD